ncbi:UNVERIFIED_CONTAM: Transcription factor b [Sesamum calycinum]|uniref:Transcription factor b n=1 Tax=Sesamum calycinum TaxID=2727403 RepID=A0AAW2PAE6_9LAMI
MVNMRETSGNEKPIELRRRAMDTVGYGKGSVEGIGDIKSEGEVVDDLFNSLMNLDQVDALHSSGMEDKEKDSAICRTKIAGGESSNNESESVSRNGMTSREGVKRSATGEIAPPPRHYRSLSMDSAMEKICLSDQSPNLQTSLCNRVDQLSPSNSISENSAKFNFDYGHGEFNDIELKKIMADERLAEIAMLDPKRAKRILANRQSAARSKERKLRYISELEHKVQTLQTEATTLSAQVTILEKEYAELTSQNNELKFRVQAMEQQAIKRFFQFFYGFTRMCQCARTLHEALTAEVQRLKLANMELREERRTPNGMAQQVTMKQHVFSMQHQQPNQMQRLSAPTSTTSTTTSTAPTSA